jgi:hypothetical protein
MTFKARQFFAGCAISICGFPDAHADHSLLLTADTPSVNLAPRSSRPSFFRLPGLRYAFTIDASCVDDFKPVSLFLSIADTRKTLHGAEIESENGITMSLDIPAGQIAPVAIRDFCIQAENEELTAGQDIETRNAPLTLPAALSAQASLRCASETAEHTVYVSRSLDVMLICELAPATIAYR